MQKYLLRRDVHLCRIDGGAILLDLPSNNYLAVPPEDMPIFEHYVEGIAGHVTPSEASVDPSRSQEILDQLVARRLLTRCRVEGRPARTVSVITSQAISAGRRREFPLVVRIDHVVAFIASYLYVAMNLRLGRLKQIIDRLRRRSSRSTANPDVAIKPEELSQLLAIFRRLRTFAYTAHNVCLFDALVLTDFLHRYGKGPTFVIGVKTKPFLAHAWVQIGDCVIDDREHQVQMLTPILAV